MPAGGCYVRSFASHGAAHAVFSIGSIEEKAI